MGIVYHEDLEAFKGAITLVTPTTDNVTIDPSEISTSNKCYNITMQMKNIETRPHVLTSISPDADGKKKTMNLISENKTKITSTRST